MSTDTDRIRALNDQLRWHLTGGKAVMTPGVAALDHRFHETGLMHGIHLASEAL